MKPLQRSLLAAAIVAALSASAYALPARAQDSQTGTTQKQDKKKVQQMKAVVVTGSLIPTAEINTATPTITITAENIKRQGFTSIYQALRAQPLATGEVQGAATSASFTQGAQSISLLGLPPDFTLFLINGHPLASYPLLYNGEANISDISNIPLAMVSRIDIVPGNQSSIYGSAAIAGVVNIILKKHAHGLDFNYQAGGFSQGGGSSQRLSLVGGYDHGPLSLVYGLQYQEQQPIYQFQRSYASSTFANPNPELAGLPSITYGILDVGPLFGGNNYIDPNSITPNACANIANQYAGTTVRGETVTNAGQPPGQYVGNGYACGSPYAPGYNTVMNKTREGSAYVSGSFRLNDHTELYGNLLLDIYSQNYGVGPFYSFWEPNINGFYNGQAPGYIFNANTGTFQNPFELFSPEEVGGLLTNSTHEVDRSYNFYGGIKGSVGSSNWNYNAYYARSQLNTSTNELHPLTAKVDAFFQNQFLGPQLGTNYGYPVYAPNYKNFYQNVTPAEYQAFSGIIHSSSEDYTQNVNLQVTNTHLFALPAGNVGVAAILQAGDENWSLPANPLLTSHAFWGQTASSGGGRRNQYAAAVEFHIPIFSMLSADISARYDRFHNDGGGSSSRPTYKVALAFRPLSTLLLRANYSTAFRMPDMGYVFVGPSGNFQFVTDYYKCEKNAPGTPFSACSQTSANNVQITGQQDPNRFLSPITAKSWGGGVVWSPTSNFTAKADYYDIRIRNEVQYQSVNSLLIQEAQCLLGQIPASSPVCIAALNAVSRSSTGQLLSVSYQPVNIASERVSGIVASLAYRYDLGQWGELSLNGNYNVTLRHEFQAGPGDPTVDLLHNPYYDYLYSQGGSALGPEYKTILSGTLNWAVGNWDTALTAIRYGKLANSAAAENPTVYQTYGAGTLPPWILYNATVKYDIGSDASVGLTVNNLFDTMPPVDKSDTAWPYYDEGAYNIYGRSYYVDFNYRF
jgi:outer membrane receptor protein involved in Fe transport